MGIDSEIPTSKDRPHWARAEDFLQRVLARTAWFADVLSAPGGASMLELLVLYAVKVGHKTMDPHDFLDRLSDGIPDSAEPTMQTLADALIEEGFEKGVEKGMEKGIETGVRLGVLKTALSILSARFGTLPPEFESDLDRLMPIVQADPGLESELHRTIATATALDEVRRWLDACSRAQDS